MLGFLGEIIILLDSTEVMMVLLVVMVLLVLLVKVYCQCVV